MWQSLHWLVFDGLSENPAVERAKALGTLKRLSVFEARLEGMTGANAGAAAPASDVEMRFNDF